MTYFDELPNNHPRSKHYWEISNLAMKAKTDEPSFEQLLKECHDVYFKLINKYIRSLYSSSYDMEDLYQELILETWKKYLPKYNGSTPWHNYLYICCANHLKVLWKISNNPVHLVNKTQISFDDNPSHELLASLGETSQEPESDTQLIIDYVRKNCPLPKERIDIWEYKIKTNLKPRHIAKIKNMEVKFISHYFACVNNWVKYHHKTIKRYTES